MVDTKETSSKKNFLFEVFQSRLISKLVGVLAILFIISLFIQSSFLLVGIEKLVEDAGVAHDENVQKLRSQAILMFIVIVLFTVSTSFVLVESIISPVRVILKKITRISEGKSDESINVRSNDELEELAAMFNKMTERFKETLMREQTISRMKSEFLGIAAHQLRTPLSAVKWALHGALTGDAGNLSSELKELLGKVYASNERMINLVNDVLNVVQIEEGRFDYTFAKGSIMEVIEDVMKEVRIIAEPKNLNLIFHAPTSPIPSVSFDREKFRLAFTNILDNAIQYTASGGEVRVTVEPRHAALLINVQDTGIGIPQHEIPLLFTKFFRGNHARSMQPNGNGLGLFITKNIIERHGGKIMVTSREGKGSLFSLILPLPKEFLSAKGGYQKFMKQL